MKLLKISPNEKMFNIGDDIQTASWYHLPETIKTNGIKLGDDVVFKWEKRAGAKYLIEIAKGSAASVQEAPKVIQQPVKEEKPVEIYKKPEPIIESVKVEKEKPQQTIILNTEIGRMTAETLIALQCKVTLENVIDLIDKIFNKYNQKLNGA